MSLNFSTGITETPIRYKFSVEVSASTIGQILNNVKPTIPQDAADEIHQSTLTEKMTSDVIIATWKMGE